MQQGGPLRPATSQEPRWGAALHTVAAGASPSPTAVSKAEECSSCSVCACVRSSSQVYVRGPGMRMQPSCWRTRCRRWRLGVPTAVLLPIWGCSHFVHARVVRAFFCDSLLHKWAKRVCCPPFHIPRLHRCLALIVFDSPAPQCAQFLAGVLTHGLLLLLVSRCETTRCKLLVAVGSSSGVCAWERGKAQLGHMITYSDHLSWPSGSRLPLAAAALFAVRQP